MPHDTYVISGVESDQHIIYNQGNLVFINKGAKQGVKVGDQFLVSRPESDLQMQDAMDHLASVADQGHGHNVCRSRDGFE